MPAASAARAMKPKCRLFAKLCTCSTQIPVRLATSESVKIFWLDFTVTMARLLCSAPSFRYTYSDASVILVQVPQKRVRHAVLAEVAATRFFDERQRALPHSPQFRQHLFLFAHRLWLDGARCLAPDQSCFDDQHRNMKSLVEGRWIRRLLQQLVGPCDDEPLDCAQVSDQFPCRPSSPLLPPFPLLRTAPL